MIGVFESEATFLKEDGRIAEASIPASEAEEGLIKTQFELPLGKAYAIAAYHDANSNEKLDKNGTFGPPAFEKAAFQLMLEKGQFVNFYLSY